MLARHRVEFLKERTLTQYLVGRAGHDVIVTAAMRIGPILGR